jgi:hypothetical protein
MDVIGGSATSMLMLIAGVAMSLAQAVQAQTHNFDASSPGALAADWLQGVTGGGAAHWAVEPDESAPSKPNVLRQTSVGSFPWIVRRNTAIQNGFVEVKFKALAGTEDQAGGVIWRWQNGDNYYVARANALENNVSLYYTEAGNRKTISYVDAPVAPKVWHTLRVEFSGQRIRVVLNGTTYIDVQDTQMARAGAVGMWTKADSLTAFDDFSYGSVPSSPPTAPKN